jgi:hypothetical protein
MRGRLFWLGALVASGLYLLNPGFGVVELFPDNIPFIGNLDESVAVLMVLRSLVELNMVGAPTVKRLLNVREGVDKAVLGKRLQEK